MPTGLSSALLAPKGQLMKHSTAVILPVLLLPIVVVLLASSCEGRGLPVHGKVRSSSKSHRLPGKDVAATSLKADGWLSRQLMEARHMMAAQQADAEVKEGMKMAAASAGAVRATATPTPADTVWQRLSQREDTGFHLDYAGPRTHTPSHN
ncbi:hypothetical protein BDA96_06G189400 [Sorghum bicolor]|uniref:Transmembrane protein n=2 Tax=Sorghum bicolor TaxID=4558 RepID=A0A921QTD6_SORBI|nr:hypothetical protein SORBI_3006G172800 [Sorghum bicolor]KAG0526940.1 hypothetical protein BDA96_06G189400 [Sorghum bicolor]